MKNIKYLLRFDDICEQFNKKNFIKLKNILIKNNIKPIIAVIPNNKDHKLIIHKNNKLQFWKMIRLLQKKYKWCIGMHGYDHVYINNNSGILGINKYSEFAGVDESIQFNKIKKGLKIFKKNGVKVDLFIAPAHSFDHITLNVLKRHSINCISDGFFKYPGIDKNKIFWIPQQLWSFKSKKNGIWTINFHINRWNKKDLSSFKKNIKLFKPNISCYQEIKSIYNLRKINFCDNIFSYFLKFEFFLIKLLVSLKNLLKKNY